MRWCEKEHQRQKSQNDRRCEETGSWAEVVDDGANRQAGYIAMEWIYNQPAEHRTLDSKDKTITES